MSLSRHLRRLLGQAGDGEHESPPDARPVPPPTVEELNHLLAAGILGWSPGHFYSAIPDLVDVWRREAAIFPPPRAEIPGIDFWAEHQLDVLRQLAPFQSGFSFPGQQQPGFRYYHDNPNFPLGEAVVLYCMLRLLTPKRIIEIGSGFSSCLFLDVNEMFFQGRMSCTFIEPYPDLLRQLSRPGDQFTLLERRIQEVDLDLFSRLDAGDVLFVDSSHVSKIGSDVNHIVFEILPRLRPGVYVHFHDVMYNFEYQKEWIYQGRVWNEVYLLRAFLQYNNAFSMEFFSSYLGQFHRDALAAALPLCGVSPGSSLWLRRSR